MILEEERRGLQEAHVLLAKVSVALTLDRLRESQPSTVNIAGTSGAHTSRLSAAGTRLLEQQQNLNVIDILDSRSYQSSARPQFLHLKGITSPAIKKGVPGRLLLTTEPRPPEVALGGLLLDLTSVF